MVYDLLLSADGRYLLAKRSFETTVYDYQSGTEHALPGYLAIAYWITPTELIYTNGYEIKRYEPVTQQIKLLTSADAIWAMAPDATGEHITVLAWHDGEPGWYRLTVTDASWTFIAPEADLWSIVQDSLSWSPDYSRLVYQRSSGELELLDPDSGEITVIDTTAGSAAHWSPDGSAFTYFSQINGVDYLKRYRLADAVADTLSAVQNVMAAPQWSPDGALDRAAATNR